MRGTSKAILALLFLTTSLLFSAEDIQQGLECKETMQPYAKDTKDNPWVCPNIGLDEDRDEKEAELYAELTDIDFATGQYACTYRYKNGGAISNICNYTSKNYILKLNAVKETIYGDRLSKTNVNQWAGKVENFEKINFENDFNLYKNKFTEADNLVSKEVITLLEEKTNEAIESFKEVSLDGNSTKIDTYLKNIEDTSYNYLVKPYVSLTNNADSTSVKNGNMSLFLAGLVTLDPDVVEGYDRATGKLKISGEWRKNASSANKIHDKELDTIDQSVNWVASAFKSIFTEITFDDAQKDAKKYDTLKVSSWMELFELKLWGYYYNLQRRFDIGYDILSMTIFWTMAIWFSLMMGARGGVAYLMNREVATQKTEQGVLKTIGVLLTVGIFFISLPSSTVTQGVAATTESQDIKDEMRKNRTLAKFFIRYSASQGAKLGTTMSDLGLEPYLSFVAKKQYIISRDQISEGFKSSLMEIPYFYNTLPILAACRDFYKANDMRLLNENTQSNFTRDMEIVETSPFFVKQKISGLSFSLCKKSYMLHATLPHNTAFKIMEAEERMKNSDELMAKAVTVLASSQILLQEKLGWINTFSVPISYFLMKHGDMFLSKGVDYATISEKTEEFVRSVGVKGSEALSLEDSSSMAVRTRTAYGKISDTTQELAGTLTGTISGYYLYNMLPFFSDIHKGIFEYMTKTYKDLLKVHYEEKKDSKGLTSLFKSMKNYIKLIPNVAAIYAKISSTPLIERSFLWNALIQVVSLAAAIQIWKMSFATLFLSSIAMLILLKTTLYFKDLLLHVVISPFIVIWAFSTGSQGSQGESKILGFLRDTLVLMFYPTLIVFSVYIFIFVYELFTMLYSFLMSNLVATQKATISLMTVANSSTDTFSSYFQLTLLHDLSGILVEIFGLILALLIILKLPDFILQKMGLADNNALLISKSTEQIAQKGDKHGNPFA
ncbi:MAG: Unknown protein [uncultured Sulfurovum sp.]|uniref:Uncharacterized protein n=1 Tax=uncultured Sulfurovum sp. TaxID=269237 RepID=A0A6S6STY9_9BACT|nr:MAG: Unknown protein [uncultured Sulfurovum sp.]